MAALRLTGAILADPASGVYAPYDVLIRDTIIEAVCPAGSFSGDPLAIRLSGLLLAPGLTDLHVHLREPGGEENECVETGLRAAAAGGFTTICAMPNSPHTMDHPEILLSVAEKASALSLAELLPIAAVTKGLAGKELTDMAALRAAGAAAFSDDGMPLTDNVLLEEALYKVKDLGMTLIDHCEDPGLKHGGLIHEGKISREMKIPGISAASEAIPIARNILLAQKTGARVHIAHISTKEGVSLLSYAAQQGIEVTAEATPHHIRLTDEMLRSFDTNAKVSPPLRGEEHRREVMGAVQDSLISCIATDHAPWSVASKARPFADSPNGIVGLETALAVAWDTLVVHGSMSPLDLLARFILGPAKVLGRKPPMIASGQPANLVAIDTTMVREVDPQRFYSKGRNSPFKGMLLQGWPVMTIYQGRVVMDKGEVHDLE